MLGELSYPPGYINKMRYSLENQMKNFRSFLKESQNIDSFVETHINFFTNVLKNKEKNSSKSVVCFFLP